MEKIEKLRLIDNPMIEGNLLKLVKDEHMTSEKKKIFNYVNQKKVQNEKYLKISDFIEYLTDYYLCIQIDPNMDQEQVERIK
jgi:hypothetical protein